jgi:hypothetical protein
MTSVTDRDYVAEMAAAIEAAMPDGDYVAPIVAAELVERLRAEDPELLSGWLHLRAAVFLADSIARRSNSLRSAARVMAPRRAFAEASKVFETGAAPLALEPFKTEYVVDGGNTRRRVADMTGEDHQFVAAAYADSKRTAALLEQFHLAVARKVGKRRTADVISEEQYLRMYRSAARQDPPMSPSAAA